MSRLMFRTPFSILGIAIAAGLVLAPRALAAPQKGGGPKVIQLEEITIEGRVQKPNAFYILNRSNIGYEVLDLRTSFVPDLIRSVQREPF